MKLSIWFVLAFVSIGALVACGGGGSRESGADDASDSQDETDLAESMLLSVSDFPTGWSEEESDEDEDSPFRRCDPEDPEGRTGRAESGDFTEGGTDSVSETVAVFESPELASVAHENLITEEWSNCVVDVVEDGDLDDREATFSDASVGELSFPKKGDASSAIRFKMHAESREDESEADAYVDAVSVRYGRAGFSVVALGVLSPFNSDELEEIVDDALAKVKSKISEGAAQSTRTSSATQARSPVPSRSPTPTREPTPQPTPMPGTRANPVPLGVAIEVEGGWTLKVVSTVPNANTSVAAENQFNEPPDPGSQFFIATVEVTRTGADSETFSGSLYVKAVGQTGVAYTEFENSCGVYPGGGFSYGSSPELFTGASAQGNICWEVKSEDADSLVMFHDSLSFDDSGRVFFALH